MDKTKVSIYFFFDNIHNENVHFNEKCQMMSPGVVTCYVDLVI